MSDAWELIPCDASTSVTKFIRAGLLTLLYFFETVLPILGCCGVSAVKVFLLIMV